jgi:sulfatase modifying factor 1
MRRNLSIFANLCLNGGLLVFATSLALSSAAQEPADGERLGLVTARPAQGQFVEVEDGFMVPYVATIPGSDVTYEMIPVPGGTYELKRHGTTLRVKIEPFWIGKTEVTWAEYFKFMELSTAFDKFAELGIRQIDSSNEIDAITSPSKLYEPTFTFGSGDEPTQPAVSMTQYSAKQYTKWLSLTQGIFLRLPSEAEWEYACRAGSTTEYSFGDDPSELAEHAWYDENSDLELGHVAQKRPNAWGLYDMHGNAAEWVLDAYDPPEESPPDGAEVNVLESIAWPTELYPRVLKGGSWLQPAEECRVTSRLATDDDEWRINDPNSPLSPWWFASDEGQQVGFRLVRPLKAPSREEQEKFWQADLPRIMEHANRRIDEEGRGERGLVDPELPKAIESLQQK